MDNDLLNYPHSGKLAYRLKNEGAKVLMAAGDTFRAVASDHLEIWVERTGCEIVVAEKEKTKAATEVVVSPPYVFLPLVKSSLRSDFHVAAQNCWVKKGGSFTGEVSAEMLKNLEVQWVILGHSERRALLGESNEYVGDKVAYALSQGLKVIACVGETLEQREAGSTMEVVAAILWIKISLFLISYQYM